MSRIPFYDKDAKPSDFKLYGLEPNSFTYGKVYKTTGIAGLEDIFSGLTTGNGNLKDAGVYGNLLNAAQNQATNLQNAAKNLNIQQAGRFYGDTTRASSFYGKELNPQMMGQFNYSRNLDPLVQQQMARAQQTTALQAQNLANQTTQQLAQAGGDNSAIAAALRNRTLAQSQLAQNSLAPQFLAQQAQMDTQRYGLNLQGTQANNAAQQAAAQQRVQNYITGLQGLGYNAENARQNYATQLAGIQANNQANINALQAKTGAAAPLQNLFGTIGQQIPSYGRTYNNSRTNMYGQNPQPQSGGK